MDRAALPLPPEPGPLKAKTRTLLEQSPAAGRRLLAGGEWIAAPLWDHWQAPLEAAGIDRERFLRIVIGYQNELRLWVMGERPWAHCAAGLAGRIARRAPAVRRSEMRHGQTRHWRDVLTAAGVAGDADAATLTTTIRTLGLEFDTIAANGRAGRRAPAANYAIVWAGGRPRDPEVCFAEARSDASLDQALAEALGRFLLRDPGYPLR